MVNLGVRGVSFVIYVLGIITYVISITSPNWLSIKRNTTTGERVEYTYVSGIFFYCKGSTTICETIRDVSFKELIEFYPEVYYTRITMLLSLVAVPSSVKTRLLMLCKPGGQSGSWIVISGVLEILQGFLIWASAFLFSIIRVIHGIYEGSSFIFGYEMAWVCGTNFILAGILTILDGSHLNSPILLRILPKQPSVEC